MTNSSAIKNIVKSSFANVFLWYDWYIYAIVSLYLTDNFFPSDSKSGAFVKAMLIFSLSFVVRPLGGWFFGWFAAKKGRVTSLVLGTIVMTLGSLLLAVAPTYEMVGGFSLMVLVISRILQGVSIGGGYGTAATYLAEISPDNRKGLFSSFHYVTILLGNALGFVVLIILQSFLTEEQLSSYGWRIAFGIGALGALVSGFLQYTLVETYGAEQRKAHGKSQGVMILLKQYPKQSLLVMGFSFAGTMMFYTYTVYIQKFLEDRELVSPETAAKLTFFGLIALVFLTVLFGYFEDKIGQKPLLLFFAAGTTLFTYPVYRFMGKSSNAWLIFLALLFMLVFVAGYSSTAPLVKSHLFPPEIRAIGVAFPYDLANSIFGGTVPLIGTALVTSGHENWFFIYVGIATTIAFLIYLIYLQPGKIEEIEK